MSFTFVQGVSKLQTAATVTQAYGSPVTAGNLLVVSAAVDSGTITGSPPIADTVGSTWHLIVNTSTVTYTSYMWWAVAGGSGANTVTLKGSGSADFWFCQSEFIPNGTPSVDGFGQNTVGPLTNPTITVTTSAATGAVDLVVGWMFDSQGNNLPAPTGYTQIAIDSATHAGQMFYKTASGSGAQSYSSATSTGSGIDLQGILANFLSVVTPSGIPGSLMLMGCGT